MHEIRKAVAQQSDIRIPIVNADLHRHHILLVGELALLRDYQTNWWHLLIGDGQRPVAKLDKVMIDEAACTVEVDVASDGIRFGVVTFWLNQTDMAKRG